MFKSSLLALLVPLSIAQPTSVCTVYESAPAAAHGSRASHSQGLSITNASFHGDTLIVSGANFGVGAIILVSGKKQNTRNDAEHPSSVLIAVDSARRVPRGEIVVAKVQNPGGAISNELAFFTGRVVTLEDSNKTIKLKTGERFLLHLKNEPYSWTATVEDVRVIRRLGDSSRIPGSQGLFEALRLGRTSLVAEGELPCHKVTPPCMAPTLGFQVKFVVE